MNQKYGLRTLIIEWLQAILNGINIYKREDHEVRLFAKILKNECDEEFRLVQVQVKDTLSVLLRSILRERFPHKSEADVGGMMDQIHHGVIDQWLWRKILERIYDS